MSHFSVLVVGDDVQYQLAPFHEFECTGTDDEFVQNIDVLEKARAAYAAETVNRYIDSFGIGHDPHEDRFYRDFTPEELAKVGKAYGTGFGHGLMWQSKDWGDELGYRAKVHFLPEGMTEAKVPVHTVKTLATFIEEEHGLAVLVGRDTAPDLARDHKYGWIRVVDGEVIEAVDRTNPNAQWDWWTLGGRYSNRLILKPGIGARDNTALKSEIDFDAIRDDAGRKAGQFWDEAKQKRVEAGAGDTWETWDVVRERISDVQQARDFYWSQPAVDAMKSLSFSGPDHFAVPREDYIEQARKNSFRTYAFVMDRKWASKVDMGWWGFSKNEMDDAEWMHWLTAQIDALPDDARLTIVDCHI